MRRFHTRSRSSVLLLGAAGAVLATAGLTAPAATATSAGAAAAAPHAVDHVRVGPLPLGLAGLPETRRTRTLQRGVTLTTIVRGRPDPLDLWTVEVAVPRGASSPDPDASPTPLSGRGRANALAAALQADGFVPRVERVVTPAVADFRGGSLGYRVRVGGSPNRALVDAERSQISRAGFAAATVFAGFDGRPDDQGPWRAWVLRIDPHAFTGRLVASFGSDFLHLERPSTLARRLRATAAVNAGFFVLDPAAGAPGDPAGVGVYGGRVLSEAVTGRPGFVVKQDGRSRVARLVWHGNVHRAGALLRLDGINRLPGLIRSCGGIGGDQPGTDPRQDVTCTDDAEAVAFTPAFGARTPSGRGVEAMINRHGIVRAVRSSRGHAMPRGGATVQATGSLAARLRAVARTGKRLVIASKLTTTTGRPFTPNTRTSVVNGGPVLVRDGRVHVTAQRDGFVRTPSFYYGFSAKRNPRTFAGTDGRGRTLVAVVDGRSPASLGLTLRETGLVAQSLGMKDALNLDGGGSSALSTGRTVRNTPSDPSGERAVGDALLVLRHR